jgi:hypothetical protein
MIVPPQQAGPPLPEGRVVHDSDEPEQIGRTSRGERAVLIVVAIMFVLLFAAAILLPHSPIAAEW